MGGGHFLGPVFLGIVARPPLRSVALQKARDLTQVSRQFHRQPGIANAPRAAGSGGPIAPDRPEISWVTVGRLSRRTVVINARPTSEVCRKGRRYTSRSSSSIWLGATPFPRVRFYQQRVLGDHVSGQVGCRTGASSTAIWLQG